MDKILIKFKALEEQAVNGNAVTQSEAARDIIRLFYEFGRQEFNAGYAMGKRHGQELPK